MDNSEMKGLITEEVEKRNEESAGLCQVRKTTSSRSSSFKTSRAGTLHRPVARLYLLVRGVRQT